jgi:hypothetical protein
MQAVLIGYKYSGIESGALITKCGTRGGPALILSNCRLPFHSQREWMDALGMPYTGPSGVWLDFRLNQKPMH